MYLFLGQRVAEGCRYALEVAVQPSRCYTYTDRDLDVRRTTCPEHNSHSQFTKFMQDVAKKTTAVYDRYYILHTVDVTLVSA